MKPMPALFLSAASILWLAASSEPPLPQPTLIRLLPPLGDKGQERILVETLTLERTVQSVVFYLDGEQVERRRMPPFEAKIRLATPRRPQQLRVEAFDSLDNLVGQDELTVGQTRQRLRVRIREVSEIAGAVVVKADIPVPDNVEVVGIDVFLNEEKLLTREGAPDTRGTFVAQIPRPRPSPAISSCVLARLGDGREIEDVEVMGQETLKDEVEVRLVQLQVVVTDRQERPVKGLQKGDFDIREGSRSRPVDRVYEADEVSLVLGLAVDSSGSMQEIWPRTREAAKAFFYETMTSRDKGFLVDFDADLRLRCGVTDDMRALFSALEETEPEGATALYDSHSFLTAPIRAPARTPRTGGDFGRRRHPESPDPKRAVDFGKKLGVPIYVIALEPKGAAWAGRSLFTNPSSRSTSSPTPPEGASTTHQTRTWCSALSLRSKTSSETKYILTYYTDVPASRELPEIKVRVQGKGIRVKTTWGVDQIDLRSCQQRPLPVFPASHRRTPTSRQNRRSRGASSRNTDAGKRVCSLESTETTGGEDRS